MDILSSILILLIRPIRKAWLPCLAAEKAYRICMASSGPISAVVAVETKG